MYAGSDVDIGIYLSEETEHTVSEIWNDLEDLLERDCDLVVINSANPSIAWEAMKGKPLVIKDQTLYLETMLAGSLGRR